MKLDQKFKDLIRHNEVILFIDEKKINQANKIIKILDEFINDYLLVDISKYLEVYDEMKKYSNFLSIPQLYVNGKFIGEVDKILQIYKNNELHKLFKIKKLNEVNSLRITLTDSAKRNIENFKNNEEDKVLRLKVNAKFKHRLYFDKKNNDDFLISVNNIKLLIDPISKTRSDNINISFEENKDIKGFKIHNPNENPKVKQIDVFNLKKILNNKKKIIIFDVRTKMEWNIVHIKNTFLFDEYPISYFNKINKFDSIAFICHHGFKSNIISEIFREKGYQNIFNIIGGINSWSNNIDNKVIKY